MSSSKSKITSVACPECKQDFEFKRVPKMASVTCPHCSKKIRLTRKKKDSTSPKLPVENQAQSPQQRLPVPKLATPKLDQPATTTPDENQPPHPAAEEPNDVPKIQTRRTRKRINLSGLQLDAPDTTDPDTTAPAEIEQAEQDSLAIETRRRKRKLANLDKLQLDATNKPQTPTDPKPQPTSTQTIAGKPPANDQPTPADDPTILPAGRRSRSKWKVGPTQPQTNTTTPTPAGKHNAVVPDSHTPPQSTQSIDPLSQPPLSQTVTESETTSSTPAQHQSNEDEPNTTATEPDDQNNLLPPKFLVADIEADENAVVLPTATGGTQVVDRTEVTVSHGDQTVTLVASTPEELKRIRRIENLVAIVIAAIMLAIAVWLVL